MSAACPTKCSVDVLLTQFKALFDSKFLAKLVQDMIGNMRRRSATSRNIFVALFAEDGTLGSSRQRIKGDKYGEGLHWFGLLRLLLSVKAEACDFERENE